jgi:hypothetical protein
MLGMRYPPICAEAGSASLCHATGSAGYRHHGARSLQHVIDPGRGTAREAADLDGHLTHNGVAGGRSDLRDLRPAVVRRRKWR